MSEHLWYTASGVLTVNRPVTSARTLAGGPAAPGKIGSWSDYITTQHPNSKKLMEGFHWDERTWYREENENIAQTVPVNWDTTVSGITTDYFQSGIGANQDLEWDHVAAYPSSGLFTSVIYRPWAPVIRHGHYYDYNEEGYLYSDDSEVVYPSHSGLVPGMPTQYNKVQLLSNPKVGVPIRADRYYWDNSEGKYEIDLSVRKVAEFTGLRDSDLARQDTWDDARKAVLWELIDDSEPEFIVVDSGNVPSLPYAIFNGQYCDPYPSTTTYEHLGYGLGTGGQQLHTAYAPIDSTMPVEVYSYAAVAGTWTSWNPITTSGDFTAGSGSFQVKVDHDLGILTFGDANDSTVNVPDLDDHIVAQYYRSLRVEYEPEWLSDLVTGYEANLNSIYRTSGRGFVYLATRANDAASIVLSARAPEISNNVFGPVYIGNTYVPIIATVTDFRGFPVEGTTVNISITSTPAPGSFGSYGDTATAITNHIGEGKAYYNPPTGISEIGEIITASGFSINNTAQTTTLTVSNLLLEDELRDVYLYQMWTNDPLQGWYVPGAGTSEADQLDEYYRQFFVDEEIYGPTGVVYSGTLANTLSNIGVGYTSAHWEAEHRDAWDTLQAVAFNTTTGNSKKVICATYSAAAYDPHTFQFGAVAPFQPILIEDHTGGGYDVTYDTSTYALPVPSGSLGVAPSGILYGYFMVAPTTVSMQASAYNSRLNQTIYSNTIQVKLQIPSYLSGMWYIDAINNTHIEEISSLLASGIVVGSGVPFGFRLRSTNITLAAALDGVTFLDLNTTYNAPVWEADGVVSGVACGVIASGIPYMQHRFEVV